MKVPRKAWIAAAGAALLALSAEPGARAGQGPADQDERARLSIELKRYHTLIEAYRKGDDKGIGEVLGWDRKRLGKVVAAAESSLDILRYWPQPSIEAATMLHTDAAFRVLGVEPAAVAFQLELAARVLTLGDLDVQAFARRWYTTVSRSLRDRAELFVAEGLLDRGRRNLPGDAGILFESGVLQEQIATFAALITITVTEVPSPRLPGAALQTSTAPPGPAAYIEEQRRALDAAARWLGQSLRADPSSELTQLHFGRVQVLRGDDAEGGGMLRGLADSAADQEISYLAGMFLGSMHRRRGRLGDAEALYRAAIDKYPASQASYVALSEVLRALGRGDESRAVLRRLLEKPAAERDDAWWWYLGEPVGDARLRVDRLRASVRR